MEIVGVKVEMELLVVNQVILLVVVVVLDMLVKMLYRVHKVIEHGLHMVVVAMVALAWI